MDGGVNLDTATVAKQVRGMLRPVSQEDLDGIIQAAASGATKGADRHAGALVKAHNRWTIAVVCISAIALMAGAYFLGYAIGRKHGQDEAIAMTADIRDALTDGFEGVATWRNLVQFNPSIIEAMGQCVTQKQSSGRPACLLPVWTGPAGPPAPTGRN